MTDHWQLREGIRSQLSALSERLECGGDLEKQQCYKNRLIDKLKQAPIAIHTEKPNEQHYEVDTAFFKLVLDKRLKYSSGLWCDGVSCLDQAQEQMLRVICDRAQVQDGQTIMDLGCGWGSLGLYICERFPLCHVLCLSNSNTQRQHIESEARKLGYNSTRLRVVTADAKYYDDQRLQHTFDRIISIEMFEHMRNYEDLLYRISTWLVPGGKLFTQILCHAHCPYLFNTRTDSDTHWMANNFFTGGTMPSADLFLYYQRHMIVDKLWIINGRHYSKTLEAWLKRMNDILARVEEVFRHGGAGEAIQEKHVCKQVNNWQMFFIMCSEVFAYGDGNHWLLAHHLLTNREQSKTEPNAKAKL